MNPERSAPDQSTVSETGDVTRIHSYLTLEANSFNDIAVDDGDLILADNYFRSNSDNTVIEAIQKKTQAATRLKHLSPTAFLNY